MTRYEILVARRVVQYLKEHHIEPGPPGEEIEVFHVYADSACTTELEVGGLYDKIFVHTTSNELTACVYMFPCCSEYWVTIEYFDWYLDEDNKGGFEFADYRPWSEVLEYTPEYGDPDAIPSNFPVKVTVSSDLKTMYCYCADGTKSSTAYVPTFEGVYATNGMYEYPPEIPEIGSSPDIMYFSGQWIDESMDLTPHETPWEMVGQVGVARSYGGDAYAGWMSQASQPDGTLNKFANPGVQGPVVDEYFPAYVGIFWDNHGLDCFGVRTVGGHVVKYGEPMEPPEPAKPILGMGMNTGHWATINGYADDPSTFVYGDGEIEAIKYCASPVKYPDGVYVSSTSGFHIVKLKNSELDITDVSIDESKGNLICVGSSTFKGLYTGVLSTDDDQFLFYGQSPWGGSATYDLIKRKYNNETPVFVGELTNSGFVVFSDGTVYKKSTPNFIKLSDNIPNAATGIQYDWGNAFIVASSGDVYNLTQDGAVKLTNKFPDILSESCQFVNNCLYVAGEDGIYKMTKSNVISKVCAHSGTFSVDSNGRVFVEDHNTHKFYMVASGSDPVEIDLTIHHALVMF